MPLPRPQNDQTKPDFIQACMASDVMNGEFPDKSQRYAVCNSLWSGGDEKKARLASMKQKDYEAEVSEHTKPRTVKAVISTTAIDRDGEVIISQGIDTSEYKSNPVLLYEHDPERPVGKALKVTKGQNVVTAVFEFPRKPEDYDGEWLPDKVYAEYKAGLRKTFSIGFLTMEEREPTGKDLATFGENVKNVVSKSRLIEVSSVSLPANQDAISYEVASASDIRTKEMDATVDDVEKDATVDNADESEQKSVESDAERIARLLQRKAYLAMRQRAIEAETAKAIRQHIKRQVAKMLGKVYLE